VTRLLVVWLALLLRVGCLLVFPALAVWAWRAGGGRRLWALTAAGLGAVLLFAVFAASAAGGNALVETHGYSYTLPGSLLLHGLTLGLPMVAASLAVRGAGAASHRGWRSTRSGSWSRCSGGWPASWPRSGSCTGSCDEPVPPPSALIRRLG
jgi:hypothetical protein